MAGPASLGVQSSAYHVLSLAEPDKGVQADSGRCCAICDSLGVGPGVRGSLPPGLHGLQHLRVSFHSLCSMRGEGGGGGRGGSFGLSMLGLAASLRHCSQFDLTRTTVWKR